MFLVAKQLEEKLSLPLAGFPVPLELLGVAAASHSSAGPETGARPACQSLLRVRSWKGVRLHPAPGSPRRRAAQELRAAVDFRNRLDLGVVTAPRAEQASPSSLSRYKTRLERRDPLRKCRVLLSRWGSHLCTSPSSQNHPAACAGWGHHREVHVCPTKRQTVTWTQR